MKAKIPKCHCLVLRASTARSFDPSLTLYGHPIHFIGTKSIKFLGMTIQVPADHHTIPVQLLTKLQSLLAKVDVAPITLHQKLLLYRVRVFPRLSWDLIVNDLPLSWIAFTLEAMTTHFKNKWVGLARSSDPSRLYLPKKQSGLGLPLISSSYQKLKDSLCCQLLTSHDPVVRHTASMKIRREGALTRTLHKPTCAARDVMQCDPGANKRMLVRRMKAYIMERETAKRLEHAKSRKHQGQLLRETVDDAAGIWSSVVL